MKLSKKSFTMVELIVVIAIIAILAVSAFVVLTKWIGKSRDSRRISEIGAIERGIMAYLSDVYKNKSGALNTGGLTTYNTGSASTGISWQGIFNNWWSSGGSGLQDMFPKPIKDPSSDNGYVMAVSADGQRKFQVVATLEYNYSGEERKASAVKGNFQENTSVNGIAVSGLVLKINGNATNPSDYIVDGDTDLAYTY